MAVDLTEVLSDPACAARRVEAANGLWRCTVMVATGRLVVLRLIMRPNPPFGAHGYPVEAAWLVLRADGSVAAIPPEPPTSRRWLHRNAGRFRGWPVTNQAGTLCLQYPYDPPQLRWSWSDGLEALVQVMHRHLVFEEYWRREGRWPTEDAPHGHPGHPGHPGRPHPLTDPRTRRILQEIA